MHLTVSLTSIERAEPLAPVVLFLAPDAARFREDVIKNFCHYVHFFRSRKDGEVWIAKTPRAVLPTLEEAFELGSRKNRLQFGALLEGTAERNGS